MPTAQYTALANITLGTAVSSVTFNSITSGFRDYVIVFDGTFAANDYFRFRFNSDSGANYNYVNMGGYSGGTSTSSSSGADMIQGGYAEAGQRFNAHISFFDVNATDKHKTVLMRSSGYDAGISTNEYSGRWANTVAVTSIRFHLWSGGNFAIGSTFTLYGVK